MILVPTKNSSIIMLQFIGEAPNYFYDYVPFMVKSLTIDNLTLY